MISKMSLLGLVTSIVTIFWVFTVLFLVLQVGFFGHQSYGALCGPEPIYSIVGSTELGELIASATHIFVGVLGVLLEPVYSINSGIFYLPFLCVVAFTPILLSILYKHTEHVTAQHYSLRLLYTNIVTTLVLFGFVVMYVIVINFGIQMPFETFLAPGVKCIFNYNVPF